MSKLTDRVDELIEIGRRILPENADFKPSGQWIKIPKKRAPWSEVRIAAMELAIAYKENRST